MSPQETDAFAPDVYVALCGAAGTDLDQVCVAIGREFAAYGYDKEIIRVSGLFSHIADYSTEMSFYHEDIRIEAAMSAGNYVRKRMEHGDAAARLVMAAVREHRERRQKDFTKARRPFVYIIRSLKHPKEYETLARIYQDAFLMVSIYEPRERRSRNLRRVFAKSRKTRMDEWRDRAEEIINKDDHDDSNTLGQAVRDTFQLGDVFVEIGKDTSAQIARLVDILFGSPFVTPTRSEHSMFHAFAASLRSADLARQVGVVIVTDGGDILAMGCNEVPKVGGGVPWAEDIPDKSHDRRDFGIGYDTTAIKKREMLREIVEVIKREWFSETYKSSSSDELVESLLAKGSPVSLREARVSNVIEFGRIVHAEMNAISDAARRGQATKDAVLYCTVFPCHMCARHIISSGIKQVFFIEPYPKSLAKELYDREILTDEGIDLGHTGVPFQAFVGVAPKRFVSWFAMAERKDGGGWALPDTGNIDQRRFSRAVWIAPDEELVYISSLARLEEDDGSHTEGASAVKLDTDAGTGSSKILEDSSG